MCDVFTCFCYFPKCCLGSGMVLDCIDSRSFPSSLLVCVNLKQFELLTRWKRTDLLALLCVMFCHVFVTFSHGVSGHVWNLIVSTLALFLLPYLSVLISNNLNS